MRPIHHFFVAALLGISARAEFKPTFEQASGFLVWDYGTAAGQIDLEDNLTDLNQPCSIVSSQNLPQSSADVSKLMRYPKRPEEVLATSKKILSQLGLDGKTKFRLRMNPVTAFANDKSEMTFFLFPEIHLNGAKQGELHNSIAFDLMMVTDVLAKGNLKIVNTSEGPQGQRRSEFNNVLKTQKQRFDFGDKILQKTYTPAFHLVDVTFGDKALSQYHDRNDLLIRNMLELYAYGSKAQNKNPSWAEATKLISQRFPTRAAHVKIEEFQQFYNATMELPLDKIAGQFSDTCELRSHEMARYSYDLAKKQKAKVVYMSFGALHTFGVLEELKKHSVNVIVFSPNLN